MGSVELKKLISELDESPHLIVCGERVISNNNTCQLILIDKYEWNSFAFPNIVNHHLGKVGNSSLQK